MILRRLALATTLATPLACGDDASADSDAEGTGDTSGGSTASTTSSSTTTTSSTSTASTTDDTLGDESESGPEPVEPGDVIDSRSFYEIGADADISDLATAPSGDVYALLDAYFPEASGWSLHRFDGGLWPSPNAAVIAFDPDGSIYCAGRLSGSADFGGGMVSSVGESDVAVVKRTPDGEHVYTRLFGDADGEYASRAVVDSDGNLVIGGVLRGSVDFGAGPFVSEDYDRFVLRLDTDGNYLDATHLDDANEDPSQWTAATADGHVVIIRVSDMIDVAGTVVTSSEPGSSDIALLFFDASGVLASNVVLPISGEEDVGGIVVDPSGELAILAAATVDVDLGTGTSVPSGNFIARLDASGMPLELIEVDNSVDADLAGDGTGALAMVGTFGSHVVQRLEPDGASAWRRELGGTRGQFVTIDGNGNVVAAGTGTADVDGNFAVIVTTLAR